MVKLMDTLDRSPIVTCQVSSTILYIFLQLEMMDEIFVFALSPFHCYISIPRSEHIISKCAACCLLLVTRKLNIDIDSSGLLVLSVFSIFIVDILVCLIFVIDGKLE